MTNFNKIISYATLVMCLCIKAYWFVLFARYPEIEEASRIFRAQFSSTFLILIDLFAFVAAFYFITKLISAKTARIRTLYITSLTLIALCLFLDFWSSL
ncbi:hypothetical protein CNR22_03515 [Sphingobacteriaceae bacterium]|nr:hypothetical protein CNR22_03515 [Sphingobacteriaceae bacterium]